MDIYLVILSHSAAFLEDEYAPVNAPDPPYEKEGLRDPLAKANEECDPIELRAHTGIEHSSDP